MKLPSLLVLLCLAASATGCGINMAYGPPEMNEWLKTSPSDRECERKGLESEWLCTEFNHDGNRVSSCKRFKYDFW